MNPGPSACEADVIPLHHVPAKLSKREGLSLREVGSMMSGFAVVLLRPERRMACLRDGWRWREREREREREDREKRERERERERDELGYEWVGGAGLGVPGKRSPRALR